MTKALFSHYRIQAFSSQQLLMDSNTQQAVFTYFIEPFLSRNDSSGNGRSSGPFVWFGKLLRAQGASILPNVVVSVFSADPGCVSSVTSSSQWIHAFLGGFSGFATLQQLHALNPNFSSVSGSCSSSSIFPPNWEVVLMVLRLLLFNLVLIFICRWIRCQCSLLLRLQS